MREIKFRTWENGKMSYDCDLDEALYSTRAGADVMQFSGVYDNEDMEVWERDIIRYKGHINTIIFLNGAFGVNYTPTKGKIEERFLSISSMNTDNLKVLGNIYETETLLKEENSNENQ